MQYLLKIGAGQVAITAWQHDGFTLHFKDSSKAPTHITALNDAVNNQIRLLGMNLGHTVLDREVL